MSRLYFILILQISIALCIPPNLTSARLRFRRRASMNTRDTQFFGEGMADGLDRLRRFVHELAALSDAGATEAEVLAVAALSLRDLVSADDWLPPEFAAPDPAQYRQYLLYCDL